MKGYADLHDLTEDNRIKVIGEAARKGNTIGVVLEKDEPKKIERYIKKVIERFPGIVVLKRIDGPTPGTITVKFGKALQ